MPPKVPHNIVMDSLTGKHGEIVKLINRMPVHFIDIPVHGNIGDLLILLGTLNFFKKEKINCERMTTYANYTKKWAKPNTVILFQGGGNLGDLYAEPQTSRERIIDKLTNNRIIILPQTIYFTEKANFERCQKIFSKHPDLHIFTRDEASFNIAKSLSENVYLTPDMAHQLWPLKRSGAPNLHQLGLIRADNESSGKHVTNFDTTADWPLLVGKLRNLLFKNILRALKVQKFLGLDHALINSEMHAWNFYAKKLTKEAIELFSNHEEIYTDRLHGHILSCLLSIPNIVSDNSYGKNFSYANLWTSQSDLVTLK